MPLTVLYGDIVTMRVDAIVNAANTELQMGGGVCGAIFEAAGASKLQKACNMLSPIRVTDAVITPGFDLDAEFIIHTVGPVYHGFVIDKLKMSYRNSLRLADEHMCKSIAFPLISSGIYGFPKDVALLAATTAILDYLCDNNSEMQVCLVLKKQLNTEAQER